MDPNFAFPRRRPRQPPQKPVVQPSRESNALRASVLDAALLLGVGTNSTVTNWMFNNTTVEEDEPQDVDPDELNSSPGLTSASTATSEESAFSSPAANFAQYSPLLPLVESAKNPAPYLPLSLNNNNTPNGRAPHNQPSFLPLRNANPRPFEGPSSSARDKSPRKLKKRRGDGYGSDGSGRSGPERTSRDTIERRSQEDTKKNFEDRGYDTDVANVSKSKSKRKPKPKDGLSDGFETDDGSTSPSKVKKGRSFFRLTTKSSKQQLDTQNIPPVPFLSTAGPPVLPPVPIPELFAGFSSSNSAPSSAFTPTRPSLPFTQLSKSASSSAPSLALPSIAAPISFTPAPPPSVFETSSPSDDRPGTASSITTAHTATTSSGEGKDIKAAKSSRRRGLQFNALPHGTSDSISSSGHSSAVHSSQHHTPLPLPTASTSLAGPEPGPGEISPYSLPSTRPLSPRKRGPFPLALTIPPTSRSEITGPASAPEIIIPAPLPSPSGTIVPSSAYIVPSPRTSILANYDIPPPSPPPTGPLPPPPPASGSAPSNLSLQSSTLHPHAHAHGQRQRGRSPLAAVASAPGTGTTLYPRGAGSGGTSRSLSPAPVWTGRNASPAVQAPAPASSSSLAAPTVRVRPPRPAMRGPPPSSAPAMINGIGPRPVGPPPPTPAAASAASAVAVTRARTSSSSSAGSAGGGPNLNVLRAKESPFPVRSAGPLSSAMVGAAGHSAPASLANSPSFSSGSGSGNGNGRLLGLGPGLGLGLRSGERGMRVPEREMGKREIPTRTERDVFGVGRRLDRMRRESEGSDSELGSDYGHGGREKSGEDGMGVDGVNGHGGDEVVVVGEDSEEGGDEIQDVLDVLGRFADFGAVRRAQGGVPVDVERWSGVDNGGNGRGSGSGSGGGVDGSDDVLSWYLKGGDERFRSGKARSEGHAVNRDMDEAEAENGDDDDDDTGDLRGELEARLNRYSAEPTLYSRMNVLDGERSREARSRFLQRVAAMDDGDGFGLSSSTPTSRMRATVRN